MANYFLKVDKDLFKLGLTPVEILLISQFAEFQNNTGDCFISDKTLAENFGVSESTIKREIKRLEELGYITRDTKNVKGGKERHITVNQDKIEENVTKRKMSLVETNKAQNEPCTSVKMSFDKGQIDTIKDNRIDNKEEDNNCFLLPNGNKKGADLPNGKRATIEEPIVGVISAEQLRAMGASYSIINSNTIRINDTGKMFKLKCN